jgi:hypothetical protein
MGQWDVPGKRPYPGLFLGKSRIIPRISNSTVGGSSQATSLRFMKVYHLAQLSDSYALRV